MRLEIAADHPLQMSEIAAQMKVFGDLAGQPSAPVGIPFLCRRRPCPGVDGDRAPQPLDPPTSPLRALLASAA